MTTLNLQTLIQSAAQSVQNIFEGHATNNTPAFTPKAAPHTSYMSNGPATPPLLTASLGKNPATRYSGDYGLTAKGATLLGKMEIPLGDLPSVGNVSAYKQDMARSSLINFGIDYPGDAGDGITLLTCEATINRKLTGLTAKELYKMIWEVENYPVALHQYNFARVVTATELGLPFIPDGKLVLSDFPIGFGLQGYNVILVTGDGSSQLNWTSTFTNPHTGKVESFNDYVKNLQKGVPFAHWSINTGGAWDFSQDDNNITISYASALPATLDYVTTDPQLMGVVHGLFGDLFSQMGSVYVAVKRYMKGDSDGARQYVVKNYHKDESPAENLTRMQVSQ